MIQLFYRLCSFTRLQRPLRRSFDLDFTTLVTEFQNTSNPIEESTVDGNERSLNHDEPSEYDIIVALAIIGAFGVLSNVSVLAVLFQKGNRKLATNRYLINIAISEYTTATSSIYPIVSIQPLPHQHRYQRVFNGYLINIFTPT